MKYTELHLHTNYSLLDGLNRPDEYMARAAELGMTHLAQTDHGTNSGHRDFQKSAKAAGIVPILGQEMYISPTTRFDVRPVKKREDNTQAYNHVIVLAQNEQGLQNLNRLSEIAWTEGFYSKPRIDMDAFEEHNKGLIVLSGCLNGLIAKAIANNQPALAESYTMEFKRIFGERFFMEIQAHNGRQINDGLFALADKHKVLPVMTSDCHFAREEDLWLEEAMLILSTNPKSNTKDFDFSKAQKMDMIERFNYAYPMVDENGEPTKRMSFQHFDLWLHSAEEHIKSRHWESGTDLARVEAAVSNTMVVANMVGAYPYHEALSLLPAPKGDNPDELLSKKAWAGLRNKGLDKNEVYVSRLEEELAIVKDKGFSSYFLIEANAINWAKTKDILIGPGRGSGAGSLLNFCLGITQVDPIEHNLLFFRFINPERNDFPDIDTDVEDRRRSEIKDYLRRQYKHVASIATFGTFQGKNSVRDAARVFMVPLGDVNRALKGADWMPPLDWWSEWESTEKGAEFIRKYPDVIKLARFMYGRLRTQGMHAGGIVVSKEPIANYAPMQTAKDNSDASGSRIPLIAYDMKVAEEIGFIKFDWLGLKALTILSDTMKMVKERHGDDIDLNAIPLDNKWVYKNLSDGWTRGVFQCEATPYTNLIIKMGGVKNFNDLVASNALVRPGAANSSAGARYIARNKGEEMVEYHHPLMTEFTKETYGVVIYQEQVMLTMTELAGMPMSEADRVRKIIGKKQDVSNFEAYRAKFIEGASKNVPEELAESLWHDFEAHAGYSFNKSHAVAYSLLSYWTAWFKHAYPLEFMTAVLGNEGDKDTMLDYLMEAKRMGIRIKLPNVNKSAMSFEIQRDNEGDFIRFGLTNVKYISGKVGNALMRHRPFKDYAHLYDTVMTTGSGLSTRTLQALNAIGGAEFPDNPRRGDERDNYFEYLNIPAFKAQDIPPKVKAQFRTLDEFSQEETFVVMGMVRGIKTGTSANGKGWARIEIVDETGTAGIFADEHTQIEAGQMYVLLISNNRVARYLKAEDFERLTDETLVKYLTYDQLPPMAENQYRVLAFVPRTTAAGKKMATAVLTDSDKNLTSALVFPTMFMRCYVRMRDGAVVNLELNETKDGAVFINDIK